MEQVIKTIEFSNKRLYTSSALLLLATIPFIFYSQYTAKIGFMYIILAFYVMLAVYLLFVFIRTKTPAFCIYPSKIVDNHRITKFSRTIYKNEIKSIERKETLLRSGPFVYILITLHSNTKEIPLYTDSIEITNQELLELLQDWLNA